MNDDLTGALSTPLDGVMMSTKAYSACLKRIFEQGGILERLLGLRHRSGQSLMAAHVARSMHSESPLLVEAGTGVGKTLAYLIPGLLRAYATGRPCVVSTHTLSLQQQIKAKDLDLCRSLFLELEQQEGFVGLSQFKVATLMGRSNYLCPLRLAQALANRVELLPQDLHNELERLLIWSSQTQSGLSEDLDFVPSSEVWEWVSADSTACNRKTCNPRTCFYTAARVAADTAQLIVINHSLLFSLIQSGMSGKTTGVLFPQDFVVLDEAHTVPEIAADHFGVRIHSFGLEKDLMRLYHPQRKKGLLLRWYDVNGTIAVNEAILAVSQFFSEIRDRHLSSQDVVRLTSSGWMDASLLAPLCKVIDHLGGIIAEHDQIDDVSEIKDQRSRLEKIHQALTECLEIKKPDQVYWLERSGRMGTHVVIRSAPLHVGPYLQNHLFSKGTSVVLTSATLSTTEGNMNRFAYEVGATSAEAYAVASPFDYEKQMRIYIASDAPVPTAETPRLGVGYMADMIEFCINRVPGGTLVLCTSYTDMRALRDALSLTLEMAGRPVFIQGEGGSRSEITEQFAAAGNGVLFGTDSFWTGVDVPGSALSQVIITRLPFDNPSHPLTQARFESARKAGRNPFMDVTLPEALIYFRQGLGRLIRVADDSGVLTCLDSRILNKPYGRQFVESLPHGRYKTLNKTNRERVFEI
jgi:ATP-dependent DNA helicase DinG